MSSTGVDVKPMEVLAVLYDLRHPDAWEQARLHARLWGRHYTTPHVLDEHYILLVFRSAGERWRAWERTRRRWILEDVEELAA